MLCAANLRYLMGKADEYGTTPSCNQTVSDSPPPPSEKLESPASGHKPILEYFDFVNKHLMKHMILDASGFKAHWRDEVERWYSLVDVEESDRVADRHRAAIRPSARDMLSERHSFAEKGCTKREGTVLHTGGWCLAQLGDLGSNLGPDEADTVELGDIKIQIPQEHAPASERVVNELDEFIKMEEIKSGEQNGGIISLLFLQCHLFLSISLRN